MLTNYTGLAASAAGVKVFGDESELEVLIDPAQVHRLTFRRTDILARGSSRTQPLCILHWQGTVDTDQDDLVMPPLQRLSRRPRHPTHVIFKHLRFQPPLLLLHIWVLQLH